MSVSSLKRKLTARQTTLREVVDEVRFNQAKELIQQGITCNQTLAQKLGYTEVSNFIRAFKRWSGESPQAFARKLR